MAAAAIKNATVMKVYGYKVATIAKVTQADWTILPEAGIYLLGSHGSNWAPETITFNTVTAGDAVPSTTATAIGYDTAVAGTRTSGGYYALNSSTGELVYVTADSGSASTSGAWTVRRGALGTTPAAIGASDVFYILNSPILGSATVGKTVLVYTPMPDDPGVKIHAPYVAP